MPLNTASSQPSTYRVLPTEVFRGGFDRGSCSWFERPMTHNAVGDRVQIVDLGFATFYWSGTEWVNEGRLPDGALVMGAAAGIGIKVDVVDPVYGWHDIIGKVLPKASGAGSPKREIYNGGQGGQYAFAAGDLYDIEFHIPHDYVMGTDIYIHTHWSHNGTAISGNVVFDFYHEYAKGHNQESFPAEKTITKTYATVNIATTPQYRHRVDEVIMSGPAATATLMDRALIEPDGLILMTCKLATLPAITGGGAKLFIHTVDVHYQSTGISTRGRSPPFFG